MNGGVNTSQTLSAATPDGARADQGSGIRDMPQYINAYLTIQSATMEDIQLADIASCSRIAAHCTPLTAST